MQRFIIFPNMAVCPISPLTFLEEVYDVYSASNSLTQFRSRGNVELENRRVLVFVSMLWSRGNDTGFRYFRAGGVVGLVVYVVDDDTPSLELEVWPVLAGLRCHAWQCFYLKKPEWECAF